MSAAVYVGDGVGGVGGVRDGVVGVVGDGDGDGCVGDDVVGVTSLRMLWEMAALSTASASRLAMGSARVLATQ